ncbi:MAG: hypothetical protein LBH69_01930 [Methanomassiliicoccaceae archaeon]|jgi:Spy/CpxP family protein refolding chaperone|nr:hypothetical protein [Methanomassiliicoccaceae archaeon]
MSDDEQVTQSSAPIGTAIDFRPSSVLTPEQRAKLDFALEKHKDALILLSQ